MQPISLMNPSTKRFLEGIEMNFDMTRPQKRFRRKKEPGAPKKALTAFLYFLLEKRIQYRKLYPQLHHREIVSEIGQEWNRMSKDEKLPYENLAIKDRERYEKEKEEYNRTKIASGFRGLRPEFSFFPGLPFPTGFDFAMEKPNSDFPHLYNPFLMNSNFDFSEMMRKGFYDDPGFLSRYAAAMQNFGNPWYKSYPSPIQEPRITERCAFPEEHHEKPSTSLSNGKREGDMYKDFYMAFGDVKETKNPLSCLNSNEAFEKERNTRQVFMGKPFIEDQEEWKLDSFERDDDDRLQLDIETTF